MTIDPTRRPVDASTVVLRAHQRASIGPWVYFIQSGGSDGPVKVGTTKGDPMRRLADMQTGNPTVMRLLLAIPGDRSVEQAHHALFDAGRIRRNGEWFRATPQLMVFIDNERARNPMALLGEEVRAAESIALKQALDTIEDQAATNARLERQIHQLTAELKTYEVQAQPLALTLEQTTKRATEAALRACGGNRTAAARILDVHERTVFRNVDRFDINIESTAGGKRKP